jgi:hypothetical protein
MEKMKIFLLLEIKYMAVSEMLKYVALLGKGH